MTVPTIQDPRSEMPLHCRFDMGGEELYAVKWYKDDHEFFRYIPAGDDMVTFPVHGVKVLARQSRCNHNSCDLTLTNLKRPESSGAYRCEVSSEAPAFRLASETHNVTVAAIPEDPPIIDGLKSTYSLGDSLVVTCTSGPGDPKPVLEAFINKQKISTAFIKDISPETIFSDTDSGLQLRKAKIQIRMTLSRKLSSSNIPYDFSCISSSDGLHHKGAPQVITTRQFTIIDHNQVINNQQYRWADPVSTSASLKVTLTLIAIFCVFSSFNYLQ